MEYFGVLERWAGDSRKWSDVLHKIKNSFSCCQLKSKKYLRVDSEGDVFYRYSINECRTQRWYTKGDGYYDPLLGPVGMDLHKKDVWKTTYKTELLGNDGHFRTYHGGSESFFESLLLSYDELVSMVNIEKNLNNL